MSNIVFSGSANRPLTEAIVRELGVSAGELRLERFPDGELHVELVAEVRGSSVFIVQPTGPPVGENLLELLLVADACRRNGATRVFAIIPYYGYARQDCRLPSEPLGVRVVSDVLSSGHFDGLVAVDLHSPAVEASLGAPVTELATTHLLAEALLPSLREGSVIVAPDLGAARRADSFARLLKLPAVMIQKTRISGSQVTVHAVSGNVRGLRPVIVDDMISTAGTVEAAALALMEQGALPELVVVVTHALLVGPARERLSRLPMRLLLHTDSLAVAAELPFPREVVSLAPMLADSIRALQAALRSESGLSEPRAS